MTRAIAVAATVVGARLRAMPLGLAISDKEHRPRAGSYGLPLRRSA